MPLEMFDGKTGPRLIARLPVNRGSCALVTTDEFKDIAVYHPEGLFIHGYPALSPFVGSLPSCISRPVNDKRERLRRMYDAAYEQLYKATRSTAESYASLREDDLRGALSVGCSQAIIGCELAILDHGRPYIDKQLICTSIIVGRPLSLRLPKGMFEEMAEIGLGTTRSITIHNS